MAKITGKPRIQEIFGINNQLEAGIVTGLETGLFDAAWEAEHLPAGNAGAAIMVLPPGLERDSRPRAIGGVGEGWIAGPEIVPSEPRRRASASIVVADGSICYFGPAAMIAAFNSQGPGSRTSPDTLPAASLTNAILV